MRRWTTARLIVAIVVCLYAFPASAQETTRITVTSEGEAPRVIDLRNLSDSIRKSIEETSWNVEQLRKLDVEIPDVPGAPRIVILSDGVDSTVLEDSIYATEIQSDAGGVMIVNRDGQRFRILGLSPIPSRPPRIAIETGGTEAAIFEMFSDVITIDPDEVIDGDVISVFGGHIEVLGRVEGSVVSVFGTIDVQGTVEQGAFAPFGTIHIGPRAMVGSDVVASEINKEPGGRIGGVRNELFFKLFGEDWRPSGANWARQTFTAIVLMKILFWIFLVLLAYALAARNVRTVKTRIQTSFVKSFFLGILLQVLFIPAVAILLVSIIGIPVAIFLVPLLVFAALVLALAAIGLFIGEKINENTGLFADSPLTQTIIGLLALQSIPLLAVVSIWLTSIESVGSMFRIVTFALVGLSVVTGYVVVTVGTGAVAATRFGRRPKDPTPEISSPAGVSTGHASSKSPAPTPLPRRSDDQPGAAPVR
ncbi:MAG: hypothetical protein Kow0074_09710 [Candidatus Zixiibacteriota bacterium]